MTDPLNDRPVVTIPEPTKPATAVWMRQLVTMAREKQRLLDEMQANWSALERDALAALRDMGEDVDDE